MILQAPKTFIKVVAGSIILSFIVLGVGFKIYYSKQLADRDSEISTLKSKLALGVSDVELNPQQERLLELIDKYQKQFAVDKLLIGPWGELYLDDINRKSAHINIANELLGGEDPFKNGKQLRDIIFKMPQEFLNKFPEPTISGGVAVTITDSGRKYLKRQ